MKKIYLMLSFTALAFASNAQLTLTGTSYTQNFDALTTAGIPTGWRVYNTATATSLGTIDATYSNSTTWGAYYDTVDCPSDVFGTGFKNAASADGGSFLSSSTCSVQESQTNRAFAVRQSSATSHPGYDPGASFVLQLANTSADSAFNLSFELQTLDSISTRVTTWTLDYGVGATPTTFTPLTTSPASLTTGGNTFGSQTVTATLPAAMNKQSQPVWIRLSALAPTTGSGNRTTTGIDNFNLTWHTASTTAVTNVTAQPTLSLIALGAATSEKVVLEYNAEATGDYILAVYDLSGRMIHTETIAAKTGTQVITLSGLNLVPGMYIAKMFNNNSSSVTRIPVQ